VISSGSPRRCPLKHMPCPPRTRPLGSHTGETDKNSPLLRHVSDMERGDRLSLVCSDTFASSPRENANRMYVRKGDWRAEGCGLPCEVF